MRCFKEEKMTLTINDVEDKYNDKKVRGPVIWKFLHSVSVWYYNDFEDIYRKFFVEILPDMLPCEDCKNHYLSYIENNPPNLSGRDELFEWVLWLHNYGAKHAWKKEYTLDDLFHDMNEEWC